MKLTRKVGYKTSCDYPDIPRIVFEGRWLANKYGLAVGDTVDIEYGRKKIVIKIRDKNE